MTTMHQSNVEEIFKFTDALVFAKMGKHLMFQSFMTAATKQQFSNIGLLQIAAA